MKLNKQGFTLVELIAAVAIISLFTIIVVPNAFKVLNTSNQKSYEILVNNIVTASKELYEEIYTNSLLGSTNILYQYDENGTKKDNGNNEDTEITITNNIIETNLQTLVSNGFLSGSKNNNESNSTKYILNPKLSTKDNMGGCMIKIIKTSNNGKVTYEIQALNDLKSPNNENICPTTEEYKKGVN